MSVRMNSPWLDFNASEVAAIGGYLGVYEVRTRDGEIVRIGYAGGLSQFGLRGELENLLARYGNGFVQLRVEITSSYLSRYQELVAVHLNDHGRMPCDNVDDPSRFGVVTPA
ncbi:MAG: hypothetical protein WA359_07445 [Acidimicrobiales bacterium]